MVHITEMRILLPLSLEEFKRGQRYGNWKTNVDNTEEGQGGMLLSSSPYYDEVYGEGVFTHTVYRLGNRLPEWVTKLVPANALIVDEKSWMTFPFMKSILTIPFFSKLKFEIVTLHLPDDGSSENVLGLSPEELAIRKIDMVDIGADPVARRDYKKHLDPALVRPKKLQRGPLTKGWQQREKPMMCAYKVVRAEANYWGVSARAEKLMIGSIRQIFTLAHKNCFCYADEWYDLTYDQVMSLEKDNRDLLKELAKRKPASVEGDEGAPEEKGKTADITKKIIVKPAQEKSTASTNLARTTSASGSLTSPSTSAVISSSATSAAAPEVTSSVASGLTSSVTSSVTLAGTSATSAVTPLMPSAEKPKRQVSVSEDDEHARAMEELVPVDYESDESIGAEFFEAEMEWALQEELSAEGSFSGLGSRNRIGQSIPVPATCPVCEAAATSSTPTKFCGDCKEFFCETCFPNFHVTPRLQGHRKHQVSASMRSIGILAADVAPADIIADEAPAGNNVDSASSSVPGTPAAADKKKEKKKKKARDPWSAEFELTPEEKDKKFTEGNSARIIFSGPPGTPGSRDYTKWLKVNNPPLNIPGLENSAGSGVVVPEGAGAGEVDLGAPELDFAGTAVELSREMVRTISAIYMRVGGLDHPPSPSTPRASDSTTAKTPSVENVAEYLAQSILRSSSLFESTEKEKGESRDGGGGKLLHDPYDLGQDKNFAMDIGPYAKLLEIRSMRGTKESLTTDALAFQRFKRLSELLVDVDAAKLTPPERTAFWINIYNAIVMHAYLAYGVPRTHYKRIMLMQKASYVIGGLIFRILAIEHNVLRATSHHPALAAVLPVQRYKQSDERQACVLPQPQPLVSFALSCGAYSAPAVRVYSVENIDEELESATQDYLRAAVGFSKNQKVVIPKILQWYGKDFANDTKGLLTWVADKLPINEKHLLLTTLTKKNKSASKIAQVAPYDWRFRYLFSQTLLTY